MSRHKKSVWDRLPKSDIPIPNFVFPKNNRGKCEDALIKMDDVTFKYSPSDKDEKVVLQNINFRVDDGDIIGVIGNNGSGKSTFLDLLIGKLQPSSGNIERRIGGNEYFSY